MEGLYFLLSILILHFVLFFFDVVFRSCLYHPYLMFLQGTGLEIGVLRVHWVTSAFNRPLQRWSQWKPRLQAAWFSVGVTVSLALVPVAVFLVLRGLFASTEPSGTPEGFELEPVVPGLNLPFNQLGNYMTALAVSGILHEIGHAMAAAREGVPLLGCGAQLLLILPIFNVNLSTQRLAALPAWKRLRVLCAGVWHNVVLALLCLLLLKALTHSPAYSLDRGVSVTQVAVGSGVAGPAGLHSGDHITGIDHCQVSDVVSWRRCLLAASHSQAVYCVPSAFLADVAPNKNICCEPGDSRSLCFHSGANKWCLVARDVVEASSHPPCLQVTLTPELDNNTRLLVIERLVGPAVLFVGAPRELAASVKLSNWVPTFSSLPSWLPELISEACSYIAALSAGMAILNLLPCYGFDGQHIVNLLLEKAFSACGVRSSAMASALGAGFTAAGTGCLLAWLSTAVWRQLHA